MCFARIASLLAVICFYAGPAASFEIEENHVYGAEISSGQLNIISTADIAAFEPIILEFMRRNPGIDVDYTVASSAQLMQAIYEDDANFDLAISSAMDLQTKLANDGYAKTYTGAHTETLPDWAIWRNQVFGFTLEPAVLVVSDAYFSDRPTPKNRDALINLLRETPEHFRGKIGTYDVRTSGLGYLFATQDSRNSESFWRLTEIMGRLEAKLYCCSSDMISDVASGKLAMAYNVLGSYAVSRLSDTSGFSIVEFDDFLSVMLRTVLIPTTAKNESAAHAMVDFLTTLKSHPELTVQSGLPPVDETQLNNNNALRPIRLGPGLLVFLDQLKRKNFLRSWANSIEQN